MIVLDVGDDAGQWRDDVGRVHATTKARFPNHELAFLRREIAQRHHRHDFEECWMLLSGELLEQWLKFEHLPHNLRLAHWLAVDLNALAERDQVRRGEQTGPQTRHAINALEHRAGRAFPIGTGDMDEAQLLLWVARERRQLERVLQ